MAFCNAEGTGAPCYQILTILSAESNSTILPRFASRPDGTVRSYGYDLKNSMLLQYTCRNLYGGLGKHTNDGIDSCGVALIETYFYS